MLLKKSQKKTLTLTKLINIRKYKMKLKTVKLKKKKNYFKLRKTN